MSVEQNGRSAGMAGLGTGDISKRIEAGTDTVLVPLGSLERHGNPFTPVGLDGIIAAELTTRAAEKANVLHTPLVPFGWAPMHVGSPGGGAGAVTLRAETFRSLLEDVARSLIYTGFNKVLFITLHGPNVDVVEELLYSVRIESGALVSIYGGRESSEIETVFDSPPARLTSDVECSMAMALVGGFKSEEFLARSYDITPPAVLGPSFGKTSGMGSTLAFGGAANIHAGFDDSEYTKKADEDPPASEANAERGERFLDILSDHLADFAREVEAMEVTAHSRDWPQRAR